MSLTAEHWRRVSNVVRGVTAGVLLAGHPGAFESPRNFGRNLQTASATELYLAREQVLNDLSPAAARAAAKYQKIIEGRDIAEIARRIGIQGIDARFHWKVQGVSSSPFKNESQMIELLKTSFSKTAPECVGYTLGMELRVVFKNLSALGFSELSGYSGVIFHFNPRFIAFMPTRVEEIPKKDLPQTLAGLKPCKNYFTESEYPTSFAKTKVVYIGAKGEQGDIYVANLDGSEEKRLTNDDRSKQDVKFINNEEVVYADLGPKSKSVKDSKRGIVKLNIHTGKEEYLTSLGGDQGLDLCPSSDVDNTVKFHRIEAGKNFVESFENVYSVDLRTKRVEQITSDKVSSAESCPTPSPDGKQIAIGTYISGRHGPSGTVIYPRDQLKNFNPEKLPRLIHGGPLFWSPDGRWLYTSGAEDEAYPLLFRTEVSSGKVESLLINTWRGVSITPDGNWIITSISDGGFATVIAQQPKEHIPTHRLFERDFAIYELTVQPKVFVPKRKLVGFSPGLTTEIVGEGVSLETSGLTDELQTELIQEDGFERTDFMRFSPRGIYWDEKTGRWLSRTSSCDDSLSSPEWRADRFVESIIALREADSDREIVVVTHSEGAIPWLTAMQKIRDKKLNINLQGIKFIFVDAPAQGVGESVIDIYNRVFRDASSDACKIIWDSMPQPSLLNFDAGKNLINYGKNRVARKQEINEIVSWMKAQGIGVYALINYQDCVISLNICLMPEELVEILFLTNPSRLEDMLSQEIPGAINIGRFLGAIEGFGHDRFFKSEIGRAILRAVIGRQLDELRATRQSILQE
ncbi:MAG: hypothetical protein G01um10145_843 [Microgenomates group bacterium Gr01-1014_5]|nr:MAG: hypothetical protein G01um10145_843 [Microgenomates group bacterium Gr01-1014_5]